MSGGMAGWTAGGRAAVTRGQLEKLVLQAILALVELEHVGLHEMLLQEQEQGQLLQAIPARVELEHVGLHEMLLQEQEQGQRRSLVLPTSLRSSCRQALTSNVETASTTSFQISSSARSVAAMVCSSAVPPFQRMSS